MTELIRKSDALHAVLHNTGDAAVAAVQNIKPVDAVPDEHGDLIDRDALLETCIYYDINPNKSAVDADNIQDMPVIIAAERKDDGTTAD